ncbi:hypothetical protein QZH41_003414 [Actinostola sp. cb2023]|nr:hypothetical protein QZH41_003414 [Actinostola sp. cb2023]
MCILKQAIKSCELHHFSDASELGYGAASYLRLVTETGQVHCALSTFWTDSTCVLRYIRNQEKRFQVFVANRVTKILSQSEETQWRYVDTASNPADEASRDNDPERIAAWILRYKSKLQQATARRKANDHVKFQAVSEIHPIEVVELQNAESALLRHVQKRCFSEELLILKPVNPLCDLRKKIAVQKGSNIYKLDPILMDGLIRVGGRLHRAPIDDETRHPIVLPKKHHIVELITSCRRWQAPAARQKMASLPADRITPSKPPFTYVGVDCFGPFEVRRGRTHVKRRGLPIEMRSDNGGNFVKGERELREAIRDWNQAQIHDYLLQRNIKWTFNPPAGSHHGGVWERCIRTVRKVMKAVVREQTLDDEGLNTLMCEAESIINSRPLTKLSDDPRDMEPLTPNHLLLLHTGPTTPPGTFSKHDNYTRRRWRQVQYLADVFWKRWIREYLPSLQERQKWNKEYRNFQVNDIVLVLDEKLPTLLMAARTHPGGSHFVEKTYSASSRTHSVIVTFGLSTSESTSTETRTGASAPEPLSTGQNKNYFQMFMGKNDQSIENQKAGSFVFGCNMSDRVTTFAWLGWPRKMTVPSLHTPLH